MTGVSCESIECGTYAFDDAWSTGPDGTFPLVRVNLFTSIAVTDAFVTVCMATDCTAVLTELISWYEWFDDTIYDYT